MEKVICVNCRKHVEYELQKTEAHTHVKGKRIIYIHTTAHCKECGMEVWVNEVDEENSVAPIVAYCKMVGLITPIQIQEGLKRYNIKSRPLSKLLGWSEITISRFMHGRLPSKTYSAKLLEIFEDPNCFRKLLLKNGSAISPIAYKKALAAINDMNQDVEEFSCIFLPYNWSTNISYVNDCSEGGAIKWPRSICNC